MDTGISKRGRESSGEMSMAKRRRINKLHKEINKRNDKNKKTVAKNTKTKKLILQLVSALI